MLANNKRKITKVSVVARLKAIKTKTDLDDERALLKDYQDLRSVF